MYNLVFLSQYCIPITSIIITVKKFINNNDQAIWPPSCGLSRDDLESFKSKCLNRDVLKRFREGKNLVVEGREFQYFTPSTWKVFAPRPFLTSGTVSSWVTVTPLAASFGLNLVKRFLK